jgi:hypothetical protein
MQYHIASLENALDIESEVWIAHSYLATRLDSDAEKLRCGFLLLRRDLRSNAPSMLPLGSFFPLTSLPFVSTPMLSLQLTEYALGVVVSCSYTMLVDRCAALQGFVGALQLRLAAFVRSNRPTVSKRRDRH